MQNIRLQFGDLSIAATLRSKPGLFSQLASAAQAEPFQKGNIDLPLVRTNGMRRSFSAAPVMGCAYFERVG